MLGVQHQRDDRPSRDERNATPRRRVRELAVGCRPLTQHRHPPGRRSRCRYTRRAALGETVARLVDLRIRPIAAGRLQPNVELLADRRENRGEALLLKPHLDVRVLFAPEILPVVVPHLVDAVGDEVLGITPAGRCDVFRGAGGVDDLSGIDVSGTSTLLHRPLHVPVLPLVTPRFERVVACRTRTRRRVRPRRARTARDASRRRRRSRAARRTRPGSRRRPATAPSERVASWRTSPIRSGTAADQARRGDSRSARGAPRRRSPRSWG